MDTHESKDRTMFRFDPSEMQTADVYRLLIGTIVPRPIAWISTVSSTGTENLAAFSFFNGVSSNPPCLIVSIARKPDGTKKDTLRNIEDTRELVVSSASRTSLDAVVQTGAAYPYGVNERELVGLTAVPSEKVRPPRIKEASVHFECVLHDLLEIGDGSAGSSTLVVARIVLFHISNTVLDGNRIDTAKLDPLGRLGGVSYCTVGETFERPIPKV